MMVGESQYYAMKAMVPEIKSLFQSRRYAQCATVCERYLSRNYDEVSLSQRLTSSSFSILPTFKMSF